MRIDKVNYKDGFAWFVVDGDTTKTYGIRMKEKTKLLQIIKELKEKVNPIDSNEKTFKDLKVKDLEGTDI